MFTEYLDEDEKAFERLNSGRLYSSRIIDAEACKQQVRSTISVIWDNTSKIYKTNK